MSVALVIEFASRVLEDNIILPLCPAATAELLCLRANKQRSYSRSRKHFAVAATPMRKRAICRGTPSPMQP